MSWKPVLNPSYILKCRSQTGYYLKQQFLEHPVVECIQKQKLFELVNLLAIQLGCLRLAVGMYWFIDLFVVPYKNQIRVL